MTIFNLRAANNVTFHWTRDFSQIAAAYAVASGVIRMQARVTPAAADPPAYQWVTGATSGGVITFDPVTNLCVFAAPEADLAGMDGTMVYDCRLELPGEVCLPLFGGRIAWTAGVTRLAGDAGETGISGLGDTVAVIGETSASPVPLDLSLTALVAAVQDSARAAAQDAADSTSVAIMADVPAISFTLPGAQQPRSLADRFADVANVRDFWLATDADDTLSFTRALATGRPVYVPRLTRSYTVVNLAIPSGATFYGDGATLALTADTTLPLLNIGASSDVEIRGLRLRGNMATQQSTLSGSCGVQAVGGSNIEIIDCDIRGFTRHGIELDGVTNAKVLGNYIEGTYFGAGILCSSVTVSRNVIVTGNTVKNTQEGNIQNFVGVVDWVVSDNICDTTSAGSGICESGTIADNITGYNAAGIGYVISGNTCSNSGNNGIHVGGNYISITGNTIINPTNSGIFYGCAPNDAPPTGKGLTVSGNIILNNDRTDVAKTGVSIHECLDLSITGNTIEGVYSGVELYGFFNAGNSGILDASVTGNSISNVVAGIILKRRVSNATISGNSIRTATDGVLIENYTFSDGHSSPCFYNTIRGNSFNSITGHFVEELAGNFNRIEDNNETSDVLATPYVISGADTVVVRAGERWRNLGASAAAASHTGDTAETVLATVTIPANCMGPNGVLRIRSSWSYPNNANVKTIRARLGGLTGTTYFASAPTTTATYSDLRSISNRGATNSQVGSAPTASQIVASASALPTSAIDTTAATTLVFTAQCANAADTITLESYQVEVLKGY